MRVVIVGGGIVGTALAASLAETGAEPIIVEKEALGGGTTAVSAAVFTWQQPSPDPYDHGLRERAWETYGPLVESGRLAYERVGMLTLATSQARAAQLRSAASTLRAYGVDATWMEPAEVRAHGLEPDDVVGGLFTPEEGYFHTDELVTAMAERARNRGADVRTGVTVTDVLVEDSTATGIRTADGFEVTADAVVNAAGPWAAQINVMTGVEVPLRHTVGPLIQVEGQPHELPFTLFESKHYVRPVDGDGAYVGKYVTDYVDGSRFDPNDPPAIDDETRAEMHRHLTTAVPVLADATTVDERIGFRTVTPDGRPFVGETAVSGFYLAVGMSGLGVTLAPAVADLLTAAMTGARPDALDPLAPKRV